MIEGKVIHNNGIISTGDNAYNVNKVVDSHPMDIDWDSLKKEFLELMKEDNLESIKDFAQEGVACADEKNQERLATCFKKVGSVGLEILCRSSSVLIAELAKRFIFN